MIKTADEIAKELIEKYRPITNKIAESGYNSDFYARKCAILECRSIIDELELIESEDLLTDEYTLDRITFYKGVITAIEQQ